MRLRLLLVGFALIAAACGGARDGVTTVAPTAAPVATNNPTNEAPTTGGTVQGTDAPTTETPDTERPATQGPAAPAINTVLSDGSAFSLADEANPVYLVFWAEW